MINSREQIEALYKQQWAKVFGTTVGNGFDRLSFLRRKSRELSAFFDVQGWPTSEDEVIAYIDRTIERYG